MIGIGGTVEILDSLYHQTNLGECIMMILYGGLVTFQFTIPSLVILLAVKLYIHLMKKNSNEGKLFQFVIAGINLLYVMYFVCIEKGKFLSVLFFLGTTCLGYLSLYWVVYKQKKLMPRNKDL